MIIIYDFDGTLTPYSLPQYEILKKCGYDDKRLMKRIEKEINNKNDTGLYEAYYKCYRDILFENEIVMTRENVCLGANKVQLNNGVTDYFRRFQRSKTGVKHYIVTSGIKDYVDETSIREFINDVYGVTFKQENGIYGNVDFLLTDEKKVEIIQKVQSENNETNKVIYFGDGLTDRYAFEYVHSIGGKNVFITSNKKTMANYQELNVNGIIDECFDADFGMDSKISKYVQRQMSLAKGILV